MYIIKNALRCIGRSKGRNVLIGIIALVIAVSACLGLSIRQAAESAKETTLSGMNVSATISYDRSGMMNGLMGGGMPDFSQGFDREEFEEMMKGGTSLSLEEYELYATASSVQAFYYTLNAYFNGSELDAVSNSSNGNSSSSGSMPNIPGFSGGMPGGMGGSSRVTGDFTVVGYSTHSAMTDFINGNSSILEGGTMFEEGTTDYVCVISEELALYNELSVGDTVTLVNPSNEEESYTLTITGIYTSAQNNDFSMSAWGSGQDPANKIYTSAAALQGILDASASASEENYLMGEISGTYLFESTEDFYAFEEEARTLGLSEEYTVSSPDLAEFENSLTPLNTLSKIAGVFLIVILIIGGVILVVLNIFNVRERKYEVGVLTAMGMKKWKVAAQFMCEILVVTMIAVIIGAAIGAVCSVPVTNALLEGQVQSQSNQQSQIEQNFGGGFGGSFPGGMGGMSGFPSDMPSDMPSNIGGGNNPFGNMINGATEYVTEVNSAMNLTVVFQMMGVGLLLTLIASAASVLFIMRYDPLKILANRD